MGGFCGVFTLCGCDAIVGLLLLVVILVRLWRMNLHVCVICLLVLGCIR